MEQEKLVVSPISEDKKEKEPINIVPEEEYDFYRGLFGEMFDAQLKKESKFKDEAKDHIARVLAKAKVEGKASDTKVGQKMTKFYFENLSNYYQRFIEEFIKPKSGCVSQWIPCLRDINNLFQDKEGLADLFSYAVLSAVINELVRNPSGIDLNKSALTVKDILESEIEYHEFAVFLKENGMKQAKKGVDSGIKKRVSPYYRRHYMEVAMDKDKFTASDLMHHKGLKQLATQLICHASLVINYFEIVPYGKKGSLIIIPTQAFINGWKNNEKNFLEHVFRMTPMIIPPRPWKDFYSGGYYGDLSPVNNLLRLSYVKGGSFYNDYMAKLNKQTDLSEVLKAVNGIQATPWVINKDVLNVVNKIIELGGGMAGIPNIDKDPKPYELPRDRGEDRDPTAEELALYKKVMPDWYRSETKRRSKVLRAIANIEIAKEFSEYDKIYIPCNMDFRGRIYPIPMFSFQGDSLNKSLLLFADPPACDCLEDIDWLAITGSNISGRDKISYADRIAWIKRHEKDILLSAEKPLEYTWWMTDIEITDEMTEAERAYADENNIDSPCEMLAFCFEWAKWKQWEKEHNGDPKGFVTGLPSHQDGTCSGLQHFSAILRDPVGGTAVNLVPQDKPNDIYKLVAERAKLILLEDAKNGTPDGYVPDKNNPGEMRFKYGTKTLAQIWLSYPKYGRKVTKRPTMTLAYGAKEHGYRDQILDDTIKPAIEDAKKKKKGCVFNENNKWQASTYMANVIWNSVDKVVVKAVEGMAWLQECAKIVCKKGHPVTWTTPLGLPVQQEYLKTDHKTVQMTIMGKSINLYKKSLVEDQNEQESTDAPKEDQQIGENKRIRVYEPVPTGNINKVQQTNGIAPNFIHSMDACHLQMAINYCLDAGMHHFATIHDSYGCPIAETKTMYKLVRKAFYDLYNDNDVLESFRNEMEELVGKNTINCPPGKGELDLSIVKDSKYIFC